MHPFSTPWKHQKTLRFSDVFRRQRKGALGTNGLNSRRSSFHSHACKNNSHIKCGVCEKYFDVCVCLNKLAFNRLLILDTEPKTFSTLWKTFIFSPVIVEKNRVIWSNSLFLIITAAKYFVETSWMSTWWKLTLTQLTLGVSLEDSIEHYALYHS